MEELLSIASGFTPILQVLLIVVLAIIFWEPLAQKLGWQPKEEKPEIVRDENGTPQWATTLVQHFNHETTELLTDIRDSLRENFAAIHAKHSEWDRRGIPTEECNKK